MRARALFNRAKEAPSDKGAMCGLQRFQLEWRMRGAHVSSDLHTATTTLLVAAAAATAAPADDVQRLVSLTMTIDGWNYCVYCVAVLCVCVCFFDA